ncbi:MAG: putative aminohydrolase SsnA [Spirochaetes bacterium]|uniref:Aminohydrolase SsnA n=1 Tax=Candidatus Ornithospirochaeta stercoripullorum TaxID=2840899 RepID=A0A9D9DXR7_9SPIO|nr:putative aminohydrolase SsnA [Candidatus Ornithospirochaeta stercoripullorum]
MADILIKNITLMETQPPFTITEGADVVITGSVIEKAGVGAGAGIEASKVIDGSGKILIPGNVCAHHHYYSALSRGMLISAGPQTDFIQVLKEWWWRLDRALDEESIYYSSLVASMEAVRAGTTGIVDHHASPAFIKGSLSAIAKGMEEVGVHGVTCYEVTERNDGINEALAGVNENIRFASEIDRRAEQGEDVLTEAMIGAHAPFTLSDEALGLLFDATTETGRGLHIHVAEDKYDSIWSHHFYGDDILARLCRFNLLDEKTLLVHGVALSEKEVDMLNERGCFLAHNARSNMNNHVGYFPYLSKVKKSVIGTDGCGGNMFEELKIAFFKNKDASGSWWPADYLTSLSRGNMLLESAFRGRARFGRIAPGYKADLVILSYAPPTPLKSENAATHFVWGMCSENVESTIINGRLVYENHHFTALDEERIFREARRVAERVWAEADSIKA